MYDAGLLTLDDTMNELLQSHHHVRVPATKYAAGEHKLRIEEHDQVPDDQSEFAPVCIIGGSHVCMVLHLPACLLTSASFRLFLRTPDFKSKSASNRTHSCLFAPLCLIANPTFVRLSACLFAFQMIKVGLHIPAQLASSIFPWFCTCPHIS